MWTLIKWTTHSYLTLMIKETHGMNQVSESISSVSIKKAVSALLEKGIYSFLEQNIRYEKNVWILSNIVHVPIEQVTLFQHEIWSRPALYPFLHWSALFWLCSKFLSTLWGISICFKKHIIHFQQCFQNKATLEFFLLPRNSSVSSDSILKDKST